MKLGIAHQEINFVLRLDHVVIKTATTLRYTHNQVGRLKWLSGFSGSNGQVVLTMDKALLWTDGRYDREMRILYMIVYFDF